MNDIKPTSVNGVYIGDRVSDKEGLLRGFGTVVGFFGQDGGGTIRDYIIETIWGCKLLFHYDELLDYYTPGRPALKFYTSGTAKPKPCDCPTFELINFGCKCGGV